MKLRGVGRLCLLGPICNFDDVGYRAAKMLLRKKQNAAIKRRFVYSLFTEST
jgi:hypothetical protein